MTRQMPDRLLLLSVSSLFASIADAQTRKLIARQCSVFVVLKCQPKNRLRNPGKCWQNERILRLLWNAKYSRRRPNLLRFAANTARNVIVCACSRLSQDGKIIALLGLIFACVITLLGACRNDEMTNWQVSVAHHTVSLYTMTWLANWQVSETNHSVNLYTINGQLAGVRNQP